MANEISQDISFSANKDGASVSFANRKFFNMTGVNMFQGTQLISFETPEELYLGSVPAGAVRTLIIKNLDQTNPLFVCGVNTFDQWIIRIKPNDCCIIQPTAGIYAQAETAAILVQIIAVEED